MYPTLFNIPYLPDWLAEVKSYGVMMMVAFLTGIWLACRRASKSQADPDIVLNMGFIALIFGVIGARLMFVWHYWDTRFATRENPLLAMLDIRAGGLEFWGGPLLVIPALVIYLRYIAKASSRWYLDITMPSLAWGLAITRIGCFLNGCCWGAVCVDQNDPARERAAIPWAVCFPYGSPAMGQQYNYGQLTLPKELILVQASGESHPVPREYIEDFVGEEGEAYHQQKEAYDKARRTYNDLRSSGGDEESLRKARARMEAAREDLEKHPGGLALIDQHCATYDITPEQLAQLSSHYHSKPVHPAQLYAVINGLLI
jgi:prolipoprotein diacylglyceryltransferase